jgi:hydroxyethylthiazole kinase-like uncharacterized protein yjeF
LKLVTAAEMRSLEEDAAAAGRPPALLMENAGRAVAEAIRDRLRGARARRIVVLVGPGNNGGDGLVAARYLYDFGAEVCVLLLAARPPDDPNIFALQERSLDLVGPDGALDRLDEALPRADAVVDAVLGTGRARPLEGLLAAVFDRLRARHCPLFAIDLPTGVDSDSGAADPHAAPADVTFALGFSKIGLHTLPGSQYAGQVQVLDIGLPPEARERLGTELLTPDWARRHLPQRPAGANKGTFGRVLVVAASRAYTGAASLACLAALRAGAGLVTLASIPSVQAAVASLLPEATHLPLEEADGAIDAAAADAVVRALSRYDVLLIGPGLSLGPGTKALVRAVLGAPGLDGKAAVVDADALNALAAWRGWPAATAGRLVLTPHPGEMARLAATTVAAVQADRPGVSRRSAGEWRQVLVLKGPHTVVAAPDGSALVSPVATAALATAGTGDVLAGAIAGFLAQGVAPVEAAGLGVYLHAAAALQLREEYGESGLLASELAAGLARVAAALRRSEK